MNQDIEGMFDEVPVLTLETGIELETESVVQPTVEATKKAQEVVLTPEEQKVVDEFAAKIDLTNSNMVLQYGAG
ncbi:MAG: toxic anion resistance protein, partial [Niameybacter sp.]